MRVLEGLDALSGADLALEEAGGLQGSVVAVGVFDGVHLGHQRLLHELLELGSELRAVPTVVTFRQHPDVVLRGASPPLLVSVPHRLRWLRRAGVQRAVLLDFDASLRELSPEAFGRRVLTPLRTRALLLGYDSALGKDRAGTPARFEEIGRQQGFAVRVARPFLVDGRPISSTRIREAIARGDLAEAERLLGRWPSVLGRVVRGDGRGRALGYPTANVATDGEVLPPAGVYVAHVLWDAETWAAVANLGLRPTFGDATTVAPVLEVHLLDFEGDLYGEQVEVSFLARIRDERKFEDAARLAERIRQDVRKAREMLAK